MDVSGGGFNMANAYYCPHCLGAVKSDTGLCPHCGKELQSKNKSYMLQVGTCLNNRYIVGRYIGRGGFGITYLGLDIKLQMYVAIKEFFISTMMDRNAAEGNDVRISAGENTEVLVKWKKRFYNEAQNLAKFSSNAHVVSVFDYFQENNTAYIVMEYIRGINLKEYVTRYGTMTFNNVLTLLTPVMQLLETIHASGLIHRDIGPTNIMYQQDGSAILMDFGTARYYGELNNKTTVVLSPGFAPLEQYQGTGNQGPWTDVYALCATIYYLLTGVVPTNALARLNIPTLQKPSSYGAEISPGAENVLLKGLGLQVHERYQSMGELLNAFYESNNKGIKFSGISGLFPIGRTGILKAPPQSSTGTSQIGAGGTGAAGTTGAGTSGFNGTSGIGGLSAKSGTTGTGSTGTGFLTGGGTAGAGGTTGAGGTAGTGGTVGTGGTTGGGNTSAGNAGAGKRNGWKRILLISLLGGVAVTALVFGIVSAAGTVGDRHRTTNYNAGDWEPDFDDPGSSAGTEIGLPGPSKETDNESKPSVIRKEGITARTDEGGNNQAGATAVEDDYVIDWKDDALEKAMREYTGISDYDIKYSDVVSYTTLRLPSSGIHDISALAGLPNLESLDLSGNKISDVSALAAIPNLTWLSLDGNSLVTLDSLKNLRNLKQLYISNMKLENLSGISGLTGLDTLYISNASLDSDDLKALSGLSGLRDLNLDGNLISSLDGLKGLSGLEILEANNNSLKSVKVLSEMSRLEELYLGENDITSLAGLESCWSLNILDLHNNHISDLGPLSGLINMQGMDLSYNDIKDVSPLMYLLNLRLLYLNGNSVTDLSPLDEIPKLTVYND